MQQPGRPPGEYRAALEQALSYGPATTREAAGRACLSVADARRTLDNMSRCGVATKHATVRVEGVKRPVPVYALAGDAGRESQPQAPPAGALADPQFPPLRWWVDELIE